MNVTIEAMANRMKPLPHRHRIAHLDALISRQPAGSERRQQLAELLCAERTAASLKRTNSHRHSDQSARE